MTPLDLSVATADQEAAGAAPTPRPASDRKVAANRRNAQRSTGPRTPEGKATSARNAQRSSGPHTARGVARSSRNALKHGLWASGDLLLDGEQPAQRAALHHGLQQTLAPQGALEQELVERIAAALWRLRRLQRVETSLHALGVERTRLDRATNAAFEEMVGTPPTDVDAAAIMEAQAWLRLAQEPDAWTGLQRAEAALERVLYRALAALSVYQGPRATWTAASTPLLGGSAATKAL